MNDHPSDQLRTSLLDEIENPPSLNNEKEGEYSECIKQTKSSSSLFCPPTSPTTTTATAATSSSLTSSHQPQEPKQQQQQTTPRAKQAQIIILTLTILTSLSILLALIIQSAKHKSLPNTTFYLAAFFVLLTVPLSLHSIILHLTHWHMPNIQRYVVRILWMVPIYSIQAWISLKYSNVMTAYLDPFRDLYEAFVISSFVYYLIELLGGEEALAEKLRHKDHRLGEHDEYLCLGVVFPPWKMGEEFLMHCKYGVLQFIVIKTVTTIVTVILRPFGLYQEGVFDLYSPFTHVVIIMNVSMAWAMYCLVKMFLATRDDLRHPKNWRPIGKFLCIKGIVFFTWWQGFGLFVLKNVGVIGGLGEWDADHVAKGLQNLLVCIEMLIFAIAHRFTFTHLDYVLEDSSSSLSSTSSSSSLSLALLDDNNNGAEDGGGENGLVSTGREYDRPQPPSSGAAAPPPPRTTSVTKALWSSTFPSETLKDIKRLRKGAEHAAKKHFKKSSTTTTTTTTTTGTTATTATATPTATTQQIS